MELLKVLYVKVSGNFIMSDNRCETVYFMMRRKLLQRCGELPVMMKDELIVGEHQVDGTWLLIYI